MGKLSVKLRLWLQGRFIAMLIITVSTTVGLNLLGIKPAFILGLSAGILNFIPNIGPLLSVVPALLLGFVQSPELAVWVIVLYIVTQAFETWLVTPLIYQQTIHLPPALVIFSQILFGVLLGFFGLLLSAPLLIVAIVLVRYFYVEDVLHDYD